MANILIDVGHPAHVHLFRNAARHWQAQGHQILFSALHREMVLNLLEVYKLPYCVTYKRRKGKFALAVELILRTVATYRISRQFKADLFVSVGSPTVGFPARLMGKPYLALTDTEHSTEQIALFKPCATVVATPSVFNSDLGPKQIRYAGFHELAYLHPEEFTPDPNELKSLGLKPGDPYFVVRFVAWGASHDLGQSGFSLAEKRNLLRELASHGRVLLSVEGEVDPEFRSFVTYFSPDKIHHLLAYATLYIGEGGTMLTEAALLGTPALFVNTLTAGNWFDLRDNYQLLYFYPNGRAAIEKALELLNTPDLKTQWAKKRAHMLTDKINPTPWLVEMGNRLLRGQSGESLN
jgi:predicted glycosyltransferase